MSYLEGLPEKNLFLPKIMTKGLKVAHVNMIEAQNY